MGFPRNEPWKCPECRQRFHVKEYRGSGWYALMPPKFCPRCGNEVPDAAAHTDGQTAARADMPPFRPAV